MELKSSSESSENMKGRGEGIRVIDGWSQWGEDLEQCGGSELQRWEVAGCLKLEVKEVVQLSVMTRPRV